MLQGVLDSARTLTGARYALITTLDGSGQAEEFLVSGLTPDEARQLWELPTGQQFFQYLSGLPGPLRVRDFAGHVRSMGLPDFHPPVPVSSFLAAPLRHQGASVGNINVARSEPGQEFTREDEETLVMFASQAALVIANARRHRDELRARSDLETLIDTSPVGVVVFALSTGTPVSFNREALRILEVLRTPGHPVEQLLEVLTIRRADGSEFSLEEFPLARMLATSETRTPRASGAGTDRGEEPPPQAWRRRAQPHLHPQRAPHRLPDAAGWNRRIADHAAGVGPLWCPLRLLAGPRQHQGVRGAPGGSPGPLGLDSVCSSRYVVMLRKVRIALSRMACLETFRGICPPRHPGRLSGPPELPPGALGSCRQRLFPGVHVPAETFLFPYAGFVGLKVCTELPDSFFRMKRYAGAGWGLIQRGRVAGEPPENRRETVGKTAGRPLVKLSENRRKTAGKSPVFG